MKADVVGTYEDGNRVAIEIRSGQAMFVGAFSPTQTQTTSANRLGSGIQGHGACGLTTDRMVQRLVYHYRDTNLVCTLSPTPTGICEESTSMLN